MLASHARGRSSVNVLTVCVCVCSCFIYLYNLSSCVFISWTVVVLTIFPTICIVASINLCTQNSHIHRNFLNLSFKFTKELVSLLITLNIGAHVPLCHCTLKSTISWFAISDNYSLQLCLISTTFSYI